MLYIILYILGALFTSGLSVALNRPGIPLDLAIELVILLLWPVVLPFYLGACLGKIAMRGAPPLAPLSRRRR